MKKAYLLSFDTGDTDNIEYRPCYKINGSPTWTHLEWRNIRNFKFTFTNLFPYQDYNFKLDTRYHGKTYNSTDIVHEKTQADFPGPPTIYNVTQLGSKVVIR